MNKLELSDEFYNTRELGGHTIINSVKKTLYKKFIRSNFPLRVSKNDEKFLLRYGMNSILDLRKKDELINRPFALIDNPNFNYYNISANENVWGYDYDNLDKNERYIEILENNKNQFGKIFNQIANIEGGLLFFCSAGKDRTAMVTCILLMLANVDSEEIANDYIISTGNYVRYCNRNNREYDKEDLSYKSRIVTFMNYIIKKYNSVDELLLNCGVIKENVIELKKKLDKHSC